MTRYDKLSQIDKLSEIIYETGYENGEFCTHSPLRVNGKCHTGSDEICDEDCIKCVKAWLLQNVEGGDAK